MHRIFQVTGLVIFLSACVLFAIPWMMNSEELRTNFAKQLSSVIGAEIALGGPVEFSVFPEFGIVAKNLSVTTPDDGFAISVDRAVAGISLKSVLSGQLHISGFEFEQPEITLLQNAENEAETTNEPSGSNDVFKTAAAILDRLSIDELVVRNGVVHKAVSGNFVELASNVNIQMAIPGADKQSSIAFSGKIDGRDVKLDATIASLRSLLDRKATAISISAETYPAPHPAIKQLDLTGAIQLAADGSYRLVDGKIESLGQPMRIDASYTPGIRPLASATVFAQRLEFDEPEGNSGGSAEKDAQSSQSDGTELLGLSGIDGTLHLQIGAIRIGHAEAGGVDCSVSLKDGMLEGSLVAERIAGGTLSSRINAELLQPYPEFRGAMNVTSVPLEELAVLAGKAIPAKGKMDANLQFAFRGTDLETLKKTINIAGKASLRNGEFMLPELASLAEQQNGAMRQINATADIRSIKSPVQLSGNFVWNGEAVEFAGKFSPSGFLAENSGLVNFNIRSPTLAAAYEGTLGMDGLANGAATIKTGSLSRLLALVGQRTAQQLGAFSYSGNIRIGEGIYEFEKTRFSLDGMRADGSAKVEVADKTSISANLRFDDLDLAHFVSAGATTKSGPHNASNDSPVDFSLLRKIQADIRLKAERIGYGKVKAGPANATLSIENGIAHLQIPQTGFYGGAVQGSFVADGSKADAAMDIDLKITNVDALPLFTDAADFNRLEGKLNSSIAISGSGNSTNQIASSLDGTADINFRDGALRGIDVAKTINNLQSIALSGYQENAADRTEFTELAIPMEIKDGVAVSDEIKLLGPLVRMEGSGNVDLAKQTIDVHLNPKLVGSLHGQGGEFDVAGLEIPLVIKGPLSNPKVYPDLTRLVANPDVLLNNLSKIRTGIRSLGSLDLDASGKPGDKTGSENRGEEKGVTGLLEQLARDQSDSTPNPNDEIGSGDIVGSIINGLARQALPQQNTGTRPMSASEDAGQNEDLTYAHVPVPIPSPRKTAASGAEESGANEKMPVSISRQVADAVVSDQPYVDNKGANDLLKGLLNSLGN